MNVRIERRLCDDGDGVMVNEKERRWHCYTKRDNTKIDQANYLAEEKSQADKSLRRTSVFIPILCV